MRDMSEWEKEYEAKGVAIVAVNGFESADDIRSWIAESGLHYEWLFTDRASLDRLGISAVPVQILVGADGNVRWTSGLGTVGKGAAAVREAIDAALASP